MNAELLREFLRPYLFTTEVIFKDSKGTEHKITQIKFETRYNTTLHEHKSIIVLGE